MKLRAYESTIEKTAGNAPQINNVGNAAAYGADTSGLQVMDKALLQLQKATEEKITADIMAANTEYTKRINDALYNNESGLMLKQQNGAANITDEFTELEKKIRGEVLKQYNFSGYNKALNSFNNMSNREAAQRYELLRKHQFSEGEKYKDTTLVNKLTQTAEFAAKNYSDDAIITHAINEGNTVIAARYGNAGIEAVQSKQREYQSKMLAAAYQSAMSVEDYDKAEAMAAKYRDIIPSNILAAGNKVMTAVRKENASISLADSIIKESGGDLNKALKLLHERGAGIKTGSFESFISAVQSQESGGDHTAENPRTGAYGLFQIMPENWGSWSKEILGHVADRNDPNAQKKVAIGKLKQYYDKYGAEGALVAWYAGPENGKRWKEGKATALGDGGEYSWDTKQGAGDEPSVREYVQQTLSRIGDSSSPKEMQQLENLIIKKVSQAEAIKNYQRKTRLEAAQEEFFALYNQGVTDSSAYKSVANKHADAETIGNLLYRANYFATASGNKTKLSDAEAIQISNMIEQGEIISKEALQDFMMKNNFTAAEYQKYNKEYTAWEKKEDKYQYDWKSIKAEMYDAWNSKDESTWFYAKQAGEEFIKEYKSKNGGKMPSRYALAEAIKAAGIRPNTGWRSNTNGFTYWQKQGLSEADMRQLRLYNMEPVIVGFEKKIRFYGYDGEVDKSMDEAEKIIENLKN